MTNNMSGWKKGFIPAREGRGACSLPDTRSGQRSWGLFAGRGCLTESSVCLCLGSVNYLCALGFLLSSSRCFICATGGVIRERDVVLVCKHPFGGGGLEKSQSLSWEQLAVEQS